MQCFSRITFNEHQTETPLLFAKSKTTKKQQQQTKQKTKLKQQQQRVLRRKAYSSFRSQGPDCETDSGFSELCFISIQLGLDTLSTEGKEECPFV